MPTYQYACTACDHAFEQFQSFTEDSLTECPECSGRLRKVFNAVGVVFKGSGFYRTDSRAAATGDATKSHHESHNGSKPEAAKAKSAKSEASTKTESSPSSKKTSDSTSAA